MTKRPPPLVPVTFCSVLLLILDSIWLMFLVLPSSLFAFFKNLCFRPVKDLKGKIVLVTGAGNGLGKELALQLSQLGCTIICVDIREEDNRKTLSEIRKRNGSGQAYTCDVSNPSQTENLAEIVLDEFGKVDILINNAGIVFGNGILTGTNEEVVRVLNVNFLSNIWMIRAFLPKMIESKEGHVVCIASASGIHSLAQANIYSSTKFALLGMVYSMIEEFRQNDVYENIKISCAMPYFIDTNKLYSDSWKLRLPAMTTEKAAALVIEGFRRGYKIYTVPWIAFGYTLGSLIRIFPMNMYNVFRDKFYADLMVNDSVQTKL